MTTRSRLLAFTALVSLSAGMAQAQGLAIDGEVTRSKIEEAFADYEYIEISYGLTQVKVEAVDADTMQKVEIVYDEATGAVIKSETEAAESDDIGTTRVETKSLTRDFEEDEADDSTSTDDDDGIDDSTGSDDDEDGSDDSTSSDDGTSSDDSTSGDDGSDDSTGGDDDDSGSGSDSSGGDDSTGGDDD